MATRSTIALEYADGTIGQVYCHWDGYLEHNGAMLSNYYSNPFILRDLIDLGDVSSLKPTIGTQHAFSRLEVPMDGEAYDKLYGNMTTFYGRDRGEEGTGAKTFIDFQDYMVRFQHEEYAYILRKDGNWYVKAYSNEFELLTEALSKCKQEECVA
jgi:hypothetical protein